MTTNPKRGRERLCAVPPGHIPDDRATIARALLARYAPAGPVITDEMLAWLGWDAAALSEIESDPRYLIGRLTQALSALLAKDVPPPDATGQLLIEAITDAIAHRQPVCCGVSARGAHRNGARLPCTKACLASLAWSASCPSRDRS